MTSPVNSLECLIREYDTVYITLASVLYFNCHLCGEKMCCVTDWAWSFLAEYNLG